MVNFGPLAAEIGLPVWDTPANFNGFRVLASLLDRRHSTEINQLTLHDVWPFLGWYTICTISGALAPDGILPGAKFTFRPSLAFSYICSVTAWHSISGRQPNFAAFSRWRHLYSAVGRHSSCFSFLITLCCLAPCGRLSWLLVSFRAHRIVSYRQGISTQQYLPVLSKYSVVPIIVMYSTAYAYHTAVGGP